MARHRRIAALVLLLAAAARPESAAQTPAPAAAGEVVLNASIRSRAESWRWFGGTAASEYAYLGSTLRAGLSQQRPRYGWQLELAAPVLLGLPDDAVAPTPQGQLGLGAAYRAANGDGTPAGLFLKQGNLRLGAAPGGPGHSVRAGRFEFADGAEIAPRDPTLAALKRDRIAHRLIGTFGWSHVGRSFDGAQYVFAAPGWQATALAVRPTRGVFDVNGWPDLEVGVVYGAATLRDREPRRAEARLFAMHYVDYRFGSGLVRTDNRPVAVRQADQANIGIGTLGGHYLQAFPTGFGTVDLLAWGAVQTGDWGEQPHRAWAGSAELGLQPAGLPALRPWLRAGVFRSSGDADPADGRHGTFFQVLPTPRIYARLPFHNLMNLEEAFGSLVLRPTARLSIRGDARALRLASGADLWYLGGGAFEQESFGFAGRPAGGSTDLATLLDLGAEYRLTPRLTASAYFGRAGGGEVIRRIYPAGPNASLGFLEVEYRR
jgi:hypothetical protein